MNDYAWFAVKGIGYLALIGFAVWVTCSGWPLWALLLLPSWVEPESDIKNAKQRLKTIDTARPVKLEDL